MTARGPDQWNYVPTEVNPADYASRGLTVDALLDNERLRDGFKTRLSTKNGATACSNDRKDFS